MTDYTRKTGDEYKSLSLSSGGSLRTVIADGMYDVSDHTGLIVPRNIMGDTRSEFTGEHYITSPPSSLITLFYSHS